MSFESPTPTPEKEPHFPSLEEIRYQINRFVEKFNQKNAREIRVLAQGKDVYHYELSTTDEKGGILIDEKEKIKNFREILLELN